MIENLEILKFNLLYCVDYVMFYDFMWYYVVLCGIMYTPKPVIRSADHWFYDRMP